jgi:two-component system, LytTR family, response regulator LytT
VIRALVVDDEAPARSELRHLLAAEPDVVVVGEAAGVDEAVRSVDAHRPDVVFLDIELPGATGLEAAPLVRERRDPPAVVFVTAHARYAVDAFAVEAFDYVLKPVDPDRLARVVARLRERASPQARPVERLPVVAAGGTQLLDVDEVHYISADGDYSRVHTYDRSLLCTTSLRDLERRLPADRFARVHRSHLVNLAKVAAVRRGEGDRLRLQLADSDRTELDVARRQVRALRERLRL